jgi:hypothetical protein
MPLSQGLPTHRHIPPAQSPGNEYGNGACSGFGLWALMFLEVLSDFGVWQVVSWVLAN